MPQNLGLGYQSSMGFDMSAFQDLMNPVGSGFGAESGNTGMSAASPFFQGIVPGQMMSSALGSGTLAGGGMDLSGAGPFSSYGGSVAGAGAGGQKGLGMMGQLGKALKATPWGKVAQGAGMLMSGAGAFRQAKRTRQGLGKAIKGISPLQNKFALEQQSMKDEAAKFKIGGRYSDIMTEQMLDTGAQAGQSMAQKFESMGISSPSMARQVGSQSRRATLAQLPGAQLSLAQGAMPYEKMAFGYGQQHKDVTEQLATLRGTRQSIDPTASLMSNIGGSLMSFFG